MIRPSLAVAVLVAALVACADGPTSPAAGPVVPSFDLRDEADLHFLQPAPDAPALAQTSVSFYAVRGQDREAFIWYHKRPDARDSTKLARFKVPKSSLIRDEKGKPIAVGDSLLITMSVPDSSLQIVNLEPAGLQFAADKPAKLTLWYLEADHDFNEDGVINKADRTIEASFQIWKQEKANDPWESLLCRLSTVNDQVEADIAGFTRYAVSY